MRRRRKVASILFYLLWGVGYQLQIVASLSFTELFVYLVAPMLVFREWPHMRRNGILPLFWLSVAVVCGCAISCFFNHTPAASILRGMAVTCCLPCAIIVSHWMLRRNMNGFKWMAIGSAISGILSTFWFQKAVEVEKYAGGLRGGKRVADDIMSGPIYWIHRMGDFVRVPVVGWYLKCPWLYCIGAPLFVGIFAILTSVSGRGAAVRSLAVVALVILGGRTRKSIRRMSRKFLLLVILAAAGAFAAKWLYQTAATSGWLGEEALKKYEGQTKGNTSMWALIMGGRMESFAGFLACIDKPIIGFGPWARDTKGYVRDFIFKFGTDEDKDAWILSEYYAMQTGTYGMPTLLPGHSHIEMFWISYGIFGLIFWLYAIYLLLRYLRQDCWAVPQWFFWLGCNLPEYLWSIFFDPFAERVGFMTVLVACLMSRAVRKGRQQLPFEMEKEIWEQERRR